MNVHYISSSDNAYACDPRIQRFKDEEKERKVAIKRAKQEAARAKAEEEEKVWVHKERKDDSILWNIS